jgi:hypothetical protein
MVAIRGKLLVAAATFWLALLSVVRLTAAAGGQVPAAEARCGTARVVDPSAFGIVTGARHEIEADYLADERHLLQSDIRAAPPAAERTVAAAGADDSRDGALRRVARLPAIPDEMRRDLVSLYVSIVVTSFKQHGDDATIRFRFTATGLATAPNPDTESVPFVRMRQSVCERWRRKDGAWQDAGPVQIERPSFAAGCQGYVPSIRANNFETIGREIGNAH